MVEDAAGRADDDGDALLQLGELAADALAAVDRRRRGSAGSGASLRASSATCTTSSRVGARTRACGPGSFVVAPAIEERQQERGGLAGAGLGLADDVAAVEGRAESRRPESASAQSTWLRQSGENGRRKRNGAEPASRFRQNGSRQIILLEAANRLPCITNGLLL